MNRITLSGWLVGPPLLGQTSSGIPVASFRLRVPRYDETGGSDEIDCLAVRDLAMELASRGRRGDRLNLEGRLRVHTCRNGNGRRARRLRVHADFAYLVLAPLPSPALAAVAAQEAA